jgi:hypothetical protein
MPNKHRMFHRWLLVLAVGFVFPFSACESKTSTIEAPNQLPPVPEGVFYIHPGIELGKISPLVYGVNHGPWAIITEKTLLLAQDSGISMIRFPGGNWGDENDLLPYHLDQFALLADQMGSQVSINVRLFRGTPEKAAALVKYTNIEQTYAVKYWGIGNEPTLFATARGVPDYGVEQFNVEWRAIAEAMQAVDPSILLIGPELHQFGSDISSTPKDPSGLDWMSEFLKVNGDLVDVVSIHRYPFPQGRGGRAATIEELSVASAEWDLIIPYLRGLIIEITGRDIPIAVTEINSHWSNAIGGEATPDSFYNAIWWADVLGRLIFNQVEIVNYFSLQSNASIGGYGLFTRSIPRPTYYVYKMYQQFGQLLVFSGCQDAQVGVYAAFDQDDVLTVMLVNLGEDDITRPLVIEGEERDLIEAWRFDEAHLLERLEADPFGSLEEIMLPGQSVTLLKLK